MLIIAFAVVIAAALTLAALSRAPEGYEDDTGFHVGPGTMPAVQLPAQPPVAQLPAEQPHTSLPAAPPEEIGTLVGGERVC